jgi:signal transduction histidine kinase
MIKGYHSKPRKSLFRNEQIILEANPHWLFLLISFGQILLFFFLYLFFACPFIGLISNTLKDYCILSASLILFFLSLIFYLEWKFNRLYLTNFRLIRERGIIGKRLMSIRLNDIEDITCTYGICGRIFGYGDLIIESAGTYGIMAFKGIPRPKRVKLLIERQMFYLEVRPLSSS